MKQFINFYFKRLGNVIVRLSEVFLQKNGQVGHIYTIQNPQKKTNTNVFLWKDNKGILHMDGDTQGLSPESILVFHNTHEYKTSNT